MTALTLFDLDHTLISVDSNQAWIAFLIDQGRLDAEPYRALAAAMEQRYRSQIVELDVEFCAFFLGTLVSIPEGELEQLLQEFVRQRIRPAISAKARRLVAEHRSRGDAIGIITATNRIVTRPIADEMGIANLIATEPEIENGRPTGRVAGIPCMRSGKVDHLVEWLARGAFAGAASIDQLQVLRFYSDSINDRALLERASEAIAVDPDAALLELARARQWPVISLVGPA